VDLKTLILSKPPVSGSIKEYWFDAQGDCTWIQFEREYETWAGIFGQGTLKNHHAASSTENELSGKIWQFDGWYAFTLEYKNWKFIQGLRLSEN